MNPLVSIVETILDRIKGIGNEFLESSIAVSIRERYEELPPVGQKLVLVLTAVFTLMVLTYWPAITLFESYELSSEFDSKREALKKLTKLEKEVAAAPKVEIPPDPSGLKDRFAMKLSQNSVKPEQISSMSMAPITLGKVQQEGVSYTVKGLTLKQVKGIAFGLENETPGLKLQSIKILATPKDPHFYDAEFKVIRFNTTVAFNNAEPPTDEAPKAKGGKPSLPKGSAPQLPKGGAF